MKKDAKESGQYTILVGPKCFGCQGFGHMKHECPIYLKSIGKSKALVVTLSDTEPKDDFDNKDDGILNVFTATVNPTDGIVEDVVEEEELVESKFEKMDDQDDIHTAYEKLYKLSKKHEKLYRLTTKKLSDLELDREELSTKFDEANQTIGALRFENNFLAEKTKKLEVELFQVRAQLKRTSSAKLDEILSIQKSASDRTGLGYGLSSSNIASSSTIVFIFPANNVKIENNEIKTELASENIDKGKSILGAPPKIEKKDVKSLRLRRLTLKSLNKSGAAGHTLSSLWSCRSYSTKLLQVACHSTEQQHDSIWDLKSASILSCSPWRSSKPSCSFQT